MAQPVSRQRSRKTAWGVTLRLLLRLVVMGVGVAIATGTALRLLEPPAALEEAVNQAMAPPLGGNRLRRLEWRTQERQVAANASHSLGSGPVMEALEQRFQALAAAQPDLRASAYLAVLDDGRHASFNADQPRAAASSIKTPLLLLTLVERGQETLQWDESLVLQTHLVAGGAGWMGGQAPGRTFPLYLVAREMIAVSDNTATNLLIERLGGMEQVNKRFLALNLHGTRINNWLPDLEGTNTTTVKDLALSQAMAERGELLSQRDRDRFRAIHASSRTNTLLPQGFLDGLGGSGNDVDQALIDRGVRILNKTGDIGTAYVDSAVIELPDGRRAVAAFMVEGTATTPYNSPRMRQLIRDMAAASAQALRTLPSPSPSPLPTLS